MLTLKPKLELRHFLWNGGATSDTFCGIETLSSEVGDKPFDEFEQNVMVTPIDLDLTDLIVKWVLCYVMFAFYFMVNVMSCLHFTSILRRNWHLCSCFRIASLVQLQRCLQDTHV